MEFLNKHLFLSSKPMIYLVNIGGVQYAKKQNKWLPIIMAYLKEGKTAQGPMIPYSAEFEEEVVSVDKDDRDKQAEKAKEMGGVSLIDRIIKAGYKQLQLCYFFTSGEDEVRQWTCREGSLAPKAAAVIHTDFEKFFVCAEVMSYKDWEEEGGEQDVKAAGKYHQKGKDYVV